MKHFRAAREAAVVALLACGGALGACGDGTAPDNGVVAGVNLDELFAPPTAAEIATTSDEWSGRDVTAADVQLVSSTTIHPAFSGEATVQVVSHTVDGAQHYGAVIVPAGAAPASLPILVVGHPGDTGIDLDDAIQLFSFSFGAALDDYVFVIPSFRSETLVFAGTTYHSGGTASPWDRDVDDALALLNAAIETTPEADSTRIGVLGLSRGAGVALLMAIRDPRIAAVVEFFGPTDFFDTYVRDIVREDLLGMPRDLPGLADLDAQFIQPLKRGELTIAAVRAELVRRSPVYFVNRLPDVQIHHGTADSVVAVSQAQRLIDAMQAAGRVAPGFAYYLYPGGGHDPLTLPGSVDRAVAFLQADLSPAPLQMAAP